jgi:hypothetical protein
MNQLNTYLNQIDPHNNYIIQFGETKFNFKKAQLAFLSLKSLQHFENTSEPFIINDSNPQIISTFQSLTTLFVNKTELIITNEKVNSLKLNSEYLDNKTLLSKCEIFASNQPQIFTLNSKHFLTISQNQQEIINDLTLIINNKQIHINKSLLCCISTKFSEIGTKIKDISINIPKEHFDCFISFLNIFSGCEFNSEKYSLSSLMFLSDYFQNSLLFEFICYKIKTLQTIDESIIYLSHPN